jgi:hypothetical protein
LNVERNRIKEIKKYLIMRNNTSHLLESFSRKKFRRIKTKKHCSWDFQKLKNSMNWLEKIFSNLKIQLKNIWYFIKNNPKI